MGTWRVKMCTYKDLCALYNFRFYFAGQSISLIGTWMQKTAVSWGVYSQTHSRFMLGCYPFCQLVPFFYVSFLGGIVADRYNQVRVMVITQSGANTIPRTTDMARVFRGLAYRNVERGIGID